MKDKKENIATGKMGENLAVDYLLKKGYTILDKNYQAGTVELDIVCKHVDVLVFVEVKTRYQAMVEPERSVGMAKQRNIIRAAETYIRRKELENEVRFDIIAINIYAGKVDIAHFEDAFFPVFYK